MIRRGWALAALALLGCGGAEQEGAATVTGTETVGTGRDCAHATVACEPGRCTAEVVNECDTPITCKLAIESLCELSNGQVGPAKAGTEEVTQLAGSAEVLEAATSCGVGQPVTTTVDAVTCF